MDKIKKIESLDIDALYDVMVSIVKNDGYSDINRMNQDLITCNKKSGLTDIQTGIYLTLEHLSGTRPNIQEISEKIYNYAKRYSFFNLFITASKTISRGVKNKINQTTNLNITFIDRDDLIHLIDKNLTNYWANNDIELLEYEKYYMENVSKENELRSLRAYEKETEKLLKIYIKPRLYKIEEDKESSQHLLVRYDDDKILDTDLPVIIQGDTGAGKSTFLRKIGEHCIKNTNGTNKKIPIFISTVDLIESNYNIEKSVNKNLNGFYGGNWIRAIETHDLLLLVDSIDEFEKENQKNILESLEKLFRENNIQYFLATRSLETNQFELTCKKLEYFQLEKFDTRQIQAFVSKFFNNESRAQELIEALKDNRILERLPMTPLSISLISILFEEKNFEVPATISDIYDNFNLLLLGKANVSHRFEFVDISFKERILSLYALKVMSSKNKIPLTRREFIEYFNDYFSKKSHPIPDGKIEEFLEFFIHNTGVLYIEDQRYVKFKHDSFMEYYSALEIFKHRRDLEQKLIDSFYDLNWQNSAVFFAGKSRDMPDFLEAITKKVKSGDTLMKYNLGVMGLGYLLQALYQTDNEIRKNAVLVALDKNIEAFDTYKKISSDKELIPFRDFKLPFLSLINMFFFFENFNSATIKEPLEMSFKEIFKKYDEDNSDITSGYKSLKLALTLNSKRIGSESQLEKLLYNSKLLNDNYLTLLADMGVDLFKGDNYKSLKKETKKAIDSSSEVIQKLLELPANSIRFTPMDQIISNKRIRLFTEGKTDAEIIEHAFIKLTEGSNPYWSIQPAGHKDGGATELRFLLEKSIPVVKEDEIAIGIFDNDQAGISAFNGLHKDRYKLIEGSNRIKKLVDRNIYAIKLPIPYFRKNYFNEDPDYNYFSIEHYFADSILESENLLTPTPIENIFKIKDSKSAKAKFSAKVRSMHDTIDFENFIILFREIDSISKIDKIDYTDR